jgi:hypothetical protein
VALVFFMTIPGLAVILVALAAVDQLGLWLHGRSGLPWYRDGHRPAPATGLDEFQAVFQPSKRHVIERRRAELMLRDDGHEGAPPRTLARHTPGLTLRLRSIYYFLTKHWQRASEG